MRTDPFEEARELFDMPIIIGAAVVTGIILLVIAQWLRPARAYDLDTAHVALALGRQRGSRAACWLAERQLRKMGQAPRMADGPEPEAAGHGPVGEP